MAADVDDKTGLRMSNADPGTTGVKILIGSFTGAFFDKTSTLPKASDSFSKLSSFSKVGAPSSEISENAPGELPSFVFFSQLLRTT